MRYANLLLSLMNLSKLLAWAIFTLVFLQFANFIISNFLIIRNTMIWFLGESGMIGFMTVQAIWFCIFILIFSVVYKVMKNP